MTNSRRRAGSASSTVVGVLFVISIALAIRAGSPLPLTSGYRATTRTLRRSVDLDNDERRALFRRLALLAADVLGRTRGVA